MDCSQGLDALGSGEDRFRSAWRFCCGAVIILADSTAHVQLMSSGQDVTVVVVASSDSGPTAVGFPAGPRRLGGT